MKRNLTLEDFINAENPRYEASGLNFTVKTSDERLAVLLQEEFSKARRIAG